MVKRWRRSGSSTAEFAAAEGIKASTLSWWAWKLRLSERQPPEPRRSRGADLQALRLVPVQVVTPAPVAAAETAIEIATGSRIVRIRRGFDREVLATVLELLTEDDEC